MRPIEAGPLPVEALRALREFHAEPLPSFPVRYLRPQDFGDQSWKSIERRFREAAEALTGEDCGCTGRACMACRQRRRSR